MSAERRRHGPALRVALWLAAGPALAASPAAPVLPAPATPGTDEETASADALHWETLPPAERATLAGWAPQWPHLGLAQRRLLAANARLWAGLAAPAQQALLAALGAWIALPATERAALRLGFQALEALPPEQQAAVRAARAAFLAESPERQRELRARFEALTPAEREALLLPPAERGIAALAQRVFSYVPAAERQQTLSMLASLGTSERERLQRRVARMAPWQRDALRRALLEADGPQARAALLQSAD